MFKWIYLDELKVTHHNIFYMIRNRRFFLNNKRKPLRTAFKKPMKASLKKPWIVCEPQKYFTWTQSTEVSYKKLIVMTRKPFYMRPPINQSWNCYKTRCRSLKKMVAKHVKALKRKLIIHRLLNQRIA